MSLLLVIADLTFKPALPVTGGTRGGREVGPSSLGRREGLMKVVFSILNVTTELVEYVKCELVPIHLIIKYKYNKKFFQI